MDVDRTARYRRYLEKEGPNCSESKRIIVEHILRINHPFSVEDQWRSLHALSPTVTRPSFYRMISKLVAAHLLIADADNDGNLKYRHNSSGIY